MLNIFKSIMSSTNASLSNRFKGALIGVLVGDCYGAPFEERFVDPSQTLEKIESMLANQGAIYKYTDDTAMTKSTCKSLIENKGLNTKRLAKEYTDSYFQDPERGYGMAVRQVFMKLRADQFRDPHAPAREQFGGKGSFGNGAAMRCCGLALFSHKMNYNDKQTLDMVENCSRITHSHIFGVHGAALLVSAIRYVLNLDIDSLDENEFLDHLIKTMSDLELSGVRVFSEKLEKIKAVIEKLSVSGIDVTQQDIVQILGNDVTAQNSVPLAIYSFLRGVSKFTDSYRIDNEFTRTLHWAISCGGDTDTIASMACGLTGAYLGLNKISENMYKKCEKWQEMLLYADKLAAA